VRGMIVSSGQEPILPPHAGYNHSHPTRDTLTIPAEKFSQVEQLISHIGLRWQIVAMLGASEFDMYLSTPVIADMELLDTNGLLFYNFRTVS